MILWTRVTIPDGTTGAVDVEWVVARDPRMSRVVGRGSARTSTARDFTVTVDAAGLEPAATYYYRFSARGEQSPVGRTRTLPRANTARVRFALASCANFPFGYFNVYGRIATQRELDAVLHLGDYKDVTTIETPSRHILGSAQEEWLTRELHESARAKRPWQILGQQVMFAPQTPTGQPSGNEDSWDGYRAARTRVFDAAAGAGVPHLVVFTGDVHSSWAYDLTRDPFDPAKYDPTTGRGAIGTEIVTPAVTSPTGLSPERLPAIRAARPHLKFVEAPIAAM